jgi:hypothetical protein
LDDPKGDALRFAQTPTIWEDLGMGHNPISTLGFPIIWKIMENIENRNTYSRGNFKGLDLLTHPHFELSAVFYAGSSMVPGCRELGHSMPNFTASSMSSVRNSEASLLTSKQGRFSDRWIKLMPIPFTYLFICHHLSIYSTRICTYL